MKALVVQAAAEASSAPNCAFLYFWGLEIVKFILKTRISAGFRFSHPEQPGLLRTCIRCYYNGSKQSKTKSFFSAPPSAIADDVNGVLLGVFLEGHQTEQKNFFFAGPFVFNSPGSTREARQEAYFRLLDKSCLKELCLTSSFDWPKGHRPQSAWANRFSE